MRIVFYSFFIFLAAVFLVFNEASLFPQLALVPKETFLYVQIAIMVFTMLLQYEAMASIKLSQLVKKLRSTLDQEKKSLQQLDLRLKESKQKILEGKTFIDKKVSLIEELESKVIKMQRKEQDNKTELSKLQTAYKEEVSKVERFKKENIKLSGAQKESEAVLTLLSLLQEEGRFIDFIMENISSFEDAHIGAVARVVHQGCRRVLNEYSSIQAICEGKEGDDIIFKDSSEMNRYRVNGEGADKYPCKAKLLHKGWKLVDLKLPELTGMKKNSQSFFISTPEVEMLNM
jgi:hypothetical protein